MKKMYLSLSALNSLLDFNGGNYDSIEVLLPMLEFEDENVCIVAGNGYSFEIVGFWQNGAWITP